MNDAEKQPWKKKKKKISENVPHLGLITTLEWVDLSLLFPWWIPHNLKNKKKFDTKTQAVSYENLTGRAFSNFKFFSNENDRKYVKYLWKIVMEDMFLFVIDCSVFPFNITVLNI